MRGPKKDKRKRRKGEAKTNLPMFGDQDDERPQTVRERHGVYSKEFISDSEDDEDLMNPIFLKTKHI